MQLDFIEDTVATIPQFKLLLKLAEIQRFT
jgi:hypothetical protein